MVALFGVIGSCSAVEVGLGLKILRGFTNLSFAKPSIGLDPASSLLARFSIITCRLLGRDELNLTSLLLLELSGLCELMALLCACRKFFKALLLDGTELFLKTGVKADAEVLDCSLDRLSF